jgi:hypothetical protein
MVYRKEVAADFRQSAQANPLKQRRPFDFSLLPANHSW